MKLKIIFYFFLGMTCMTLGCSESEAQKKTDGQSASSYDYEGKIPALATSGGRYELNFPKSIELSVFKRKNVGRPILDKVYPGVNKNLPPIGNEAAFSKKLSEYRRYHVALYSDETYSIPFVQGIQLYYLGLWDKLSPKKLKVLACSNQLKGHFCNIYPAMEEKYGWKWVYSIIENNPTKKINPGYYAQRLKKMGFYFLPNIQGHKGVNLHSVLGECAINSEKAKNYHCLFMGFVGEDKHLAFRFDVLFPKKNITRDQLYQKLHGELTELQKLLSTAVIKQF